MTATVSNVLNRTDWPLLAQQKAALVNLDGPASIELLEGLLAWIDALQDAAEGEGYPVVFIEGDET